MPKVSDTYGLCYSVPAVYVRPDYHEDGIYHVYNRGVAKLPIFLKNSDYFDFREIMRYYLIGFPAVKVSDTFIAGSKRWRMQNKPVSFSADPESNGMFHTVIDLIAYCLMPNHIHFLIRIRKAKVSDTFALPEFMKRVSITYAHKFNKDNNRVGAIFQGRFKVKEVDSDELVAHVARYAHINPVMAGLVDKPENWQWSDIQEYYHFQPLKPKTLSKPLFVMEYFNRNPKQYRDFVEAQFTDSDARIVAPVAIDLED